MAQKWPKDSQIAVKKVVYAKFYVHENILRTRNCRRKFIKNLLPKKRKENTETAIENRENRDWKIEIIKA